MKHLFDSDVLIAIFGSNPRAIHTLKDVRQEGVG